MEENNKAPDQAGQVETTGHQWDDDEGFPLQEYNNPLPRWWLNGFYATIVFAVVYWVLYPAWPLPGGFTEGVLGWSQYAQLDAEVAEAREMQRPMDDKLAALSLEEIDNDPGLRAYALSGGRAVFGDNCAPCHGGGGEGARAQGFPSLVDDDWLFGGSLETIHETVTYGREAMMPAHLESAGGGFTQAQVTDLVEFVVSISGRQGDAAAAARGAELFAGDAGCNGCHGDNGRGSLNGRAFGEALDPSIGAPNLTDAVWLYGGDRETLMATIGKGRTGSMPAWGQEGDGMGRRLDPLSIKQVTIYVHSLSGGV